uniref:Putative rab gtpase-activating protein 1 n=3 Tax=Ixodes ricinus TaxID=34613 RepID=A0A131XQY4_IXORI
MEEEASSDSLATSEEYELVCADQPRLSIAGNGSQDQLQSRLTELLAEGATGRQAAPSEGPPPPAETGPTGEVGDADQAMKAPVEVSNSSGSAGSPAAAQASEGRGDLDQGMPEEQHPHGREQAFDQVAYLGCAAINAPRSELEIQRNMAILNDQSADQHIQVALVVPPDSEGVVAVYESSTRSEVASFPIQRILFCARGALGSPEQHCFAFTCSHGSSPESAIFQCHVFRCGRGGPPAVQRVLHSFAAAFRRVPRTPAPSGPAPPFSSVGTGVPNNEQVHTFEATLDVREEDQRGNFSACARDKDCFKFRCNLEKVVQVTVQQTASTRELGIERCFGMLICPGRHVKHSDMQLIGMVSMAKSTVGTEPTAYQITGQWNPLDPAFELLNTETSRDTRVYLTVAVDLVVSGVQEPVRFVIETKAKIFPQAEKFWYFSRKPFQEDFYLRLREVDPDQATTEHSWEVVSVSSGSQIRRKAALSLALDQQALALHDPSPNSPSAEDSDVDEPLLSGTGDVSKDCSEGELEGWAQVLAKWRQAGLGPDAAPRALGPLVRAHGIPEALRGEVWQLLAGAAQDPGAAQAYRLLLARDCPCEGVIQRDVHRTFPAHDFFRESGGAGQDSLYKICKAYAVQDPEVGYCQGLSFLAAALLLHMPEEEAFGVFCKVMRDYGLRDLFRNSFECLHLKLFQLERLMEDQLPELHAHFLDLGVEAHMFGSQWFLTLFTAKFPLHVVFFILDLFLLDGMDTLFQVAVALLTLSCRDLLALDFEGVLKHFRVAVPKKYRSEEAAKTLLHTAVAIKVKKLKRYEREYQVHKEQERQMEDPVQVLQKEKQRLMESNLRLERENDELAHELVASKIQLRRDLDSAEDRADALSKELQTTASSLAELEEEKKRLDTEVVQVKEMCRRELQSAEAEAQRKTTILAEYKQICSQLSQQLEREQRRNKESLGALRAQACECCAALVQRVGEGGPLAPGGDSGGPHPGPPDHDGDDPGAQLRQLELELAQTKLALVEAQCRNQDLTHQLSCASAELHASKNTWLHKTLSSIREVARKEPASPGTNPKEATGPSA